MISKNISIRFLMGGFIIAALVLIVMEQVSGHKNKILADQIEKMYHQPFAVSNAILRADASIISMHRYMKDVALARNAADLELAISRVDHDEKQVYRYFEIAIDRFQGDKSKIEAVRQEFSNWKNIRSEVIALTQAGEYERAATITKGKGAEYVAHLAGQMGNLIDYTQIKAADFLSKSKSIYKDITSQLRFLMAVLLLSIGIVAVVVSNKVALVEKTLEKNLAQTDLNERRFRSIFNATPDGMVLTDTERRIIEANNGMKTTFGYENHELIGKKTSIFYESIEEFERQGQLRFNLSSQERLEPYTTIYRHKDGHMFPAESLGTTVKNDDGEIIYYLGVMRDISERKEMEKALRQSQKMDSMGNLAGGIAHDVNNMLLPIITLSEMTMKDLPEGSRAQKRLKKVVEAGIKAKNLIAGITAFSHRSDGDVKREKVNLVDLIQETLEIIRSTLPSTITVTANLDAHIGLVKCDPSQISSILLNMASNAADAMEGHVGELTFSVIAMEVSEHFAESIPNLNCGQFAKLSVSDTGKGIDEKTLSHIFDPFFTTKMVGKGAGLGLAMAHGITTKHGGAIDVSSEVGVGTTFDIYLPLAEQRS